MKKKKKIPQKKTEKLKEKEKEQKEKEQKQKQYTPTAWIDLITQDPLETTRIENQPFDWTKVKLPKRRWEKRPRLSDTTNEAVNEELVKHIEEEYNGEKPKKSKPQKEMEPDQRAKVIQNMLAKGNLNIGIVPLKTDHIARVEQILIKRGVIGKNESPAARKQRTVKSDYKKLDK